MKKHLIIPLTTLVIFLLISCSGTKIINYIGGNPRLVKKSTVIFMPISGLSEFASQSKFVEAQKELTSNFDEILYLPFEEINIFQKGISMEIVHDKKHFDSLKIILKEHFDIDYLIEVSLLGSQDGGIYTYSTSRDLQYATNQDKNDNMGKLFFTIHRIKQNVIVAKFQVTTTISPLTWGKDNGEQVGMNLSTENMAINTAFKKGLRRIKKYMIENIE